MTTYRLTTYRPTTYRPPTNHLLTTYQPLTDHLLTTYWPSTDHLPTDHLPTTYRPPTDHLLTIYWPPTDCLPTTFLRCSLFTITDTDISLDSEDDYRSGSQNVSHHQQSSEDFYHMDKHTRQTTVNTLWRRCSSCLTSWLTFHLTVEYLFFSFFWTVTSILWMQRISLRTISWYGSEVLWFYFL